VTKVQTTRTRIRLTTHLRDKAGRLLFRALISLPRRTALSFSEVKWLARVPSSYDALSLWQLGRAKHPEPAMDAETVRRLVADAESNPFAAGTETLNFLDACVRRLRPRAILEFGSGVSTLVFAAHMAALHDETGPWVFAIDEAQDYLDETRHMLESVGLGSSARLARCKVREQVIRGHVTACYDIDEGFLRSFLPTTPDLVFIDGPSGGGMVRFGTLPLVLRHLDAGCTFFLDDALRQDEIQVASLWQKFPEIEFAAVHVVGHGLLEGKVVHANATTMHDSHLLGGR
jgi:predicted O-methyltransferase YrrM